MIFARNKINIEIVETLLYAGVFDEILVNQSRMYYIHNLKEIYLKAPTMTATGELLVSLNLIDIKETPKITLQLKEKMRDLLPFSLD
jgi:hypothetical protein